MQMGRSLKDHLSDRVGADPLRAAVDSVIETLAAASVEVSELVSLGELAGPLGQRLGRNAGGDVQKALDVRANDMFREALRYGPIAAFASEEADVVEILNLEGSLRIAMDPIDGSGNIDVNMPVGTIFSILPQAFAPASAPCEDGFQWPPGTTQCAAGFVIYGPQTTLVLSTGNGVDMFTLERSSRTYRLTHHALSIPHDGPDEFAINASNHRHWDEPIRIFVNECLAGADGPYGRDFNMRWHGAMVAEAYRILTRGGIFVYPADARKSYAQGRLRLIYEAFPIAFLMEQAGGAATTGQSRILDLAPTTLHQFVPLIFGSKAQVTRLEGLHRLGGLWPESTDPLFAHRGLFRA